MSHATGSARRIVIRWRTPRPAAAIGNTLHRAYPAAESPCFDEALDAIDEAERKVRNLDGATDKTE